MLLVSLDLRSMESFTDSIKLSTLSLKKFTNSFELDRFFRVTYNNIFH